ncbi:MAG: uracil-DNA glycosylase [Gammaproteobacteria bacterium]|nr:uracil-DNA glycosylase [Gammaproteobacteria bacterium]
MTRKKPKGFDPNCKKCPRLAQFLKDIRKQYPDYFSKAVPAFGDENARLCIVGLAPGMHGANATGRPFTGDHAGILLYQTLHKYGFASAPESTSADDGLKLPNCRITNAVKCLPPQNKPVGAEVNTCNTWLAQELEDLPSNHVIVALGGIAHKAVIKALGLKQSDYSFGHAVEHQLERGVLIDCYHCSRYNTQTKRLTTPMFEKVFKRAQTLLN